MELKKRLGFLSYAVNGAGVGHVVRQVAIQKWLRRLCAAHGVKSEHWFLTTSEADALIFREGFAAFKLPSKTIVEAAGVDKLAYLALAKQWVWHSLSLLRPDALIVDTFAEGSFHELPSVLDLVKTSILVQRPVKETFAQRAGAQALVQAYDKVIIPEHEEDEPELRERLGVAPSRLHFVGPVVRPDIAQARSRSEARARLGVPTHARCVLVTAGGGGDDGVSAFFDAVDDAVAAFKASDVTGGVEVHVVYAAGPLFRGMPRHGPHRTFFVGHDLAEHAAAFDVAVTAAGFNTIHELLLFGVPLVVVPQQKIADDQTARAQRYADRGALVLSSLATVAGDLARVLGSDDERAALSVAARQVMPHSHAKDAAIAILQAMWPPSMVAAADRLVTNDVVAAVEAAGDDLGDVFALALVIADHDDRAGLATADVSAAISLVQDSQTPAAVLIQMGEQLRKKVQVRDLPQALRTLCGGAVIGQHHAACELLKAFAPERHVDVDVVVDAVQRVALRASFAGDGLTDVTMRFRRARPPTAALVSQLGSVNAARLEVCLKGSP